MARISISHDAIRYLLKKSKRPNVVIYRDVFSTRHGPVYIPCARTTSIEPMGRFDPSNHAGITVWIERDFLGQLSPDESIGIGLNRGLVKSLSVEVASERLSQVA